MLSWPLALTAGHSLGRRPYLHPGCWPVIALRGPLPLETAEWAVGKMANGAELYWNQMKSGKVGQSTAAIVAAAFLMACQHDRLCAAPTSTALLWPAYQEDPSVMGRNLVGRWRGEEFCRLTYKTTDRTGRSQCAVRRGSLVGGCQLVASSLKGIWQ